jgi:type I restriction enzyme S subunit
MAGRYHFYSEYKDSGIVWVGKVPDHWQPVRFKHVLLEKKKTSNPSLEAGSISFGNVVFKNSDNLSAETKDSYQEVLAGEFLINPLNLNYDLRSLRTALSEINVVVSTGYIVLLSNDLLIKKYTRWLLQQFDVAHMKTLGSGVRQTINYSDIRNSFFFEPSQDEQTKIANFLDHETAKIDTLIDKQQQLIKLLKEKRQAVISHAVTKGLNPAAPMKDSGIEWLGEVPEHWKVGKSGFYLSILSGFAFPSTGFTEDESDTRLLRGINVGVSRLKWEETAYWQRSLNDGLDTYEMRVGDLVMGMDRPLISEGIRVAKVEEKDLPCLLLQRVIKIKTGKLLNADYLLGLLSSNMFVAHFSPDTTGVSVPHISPEQVRNFIIPVPPAEEQNDIITFLKKQTHKFDSLTEKAERVITLFQERRTALISAAVTGKIDVRNWQPALSELGKEG